MSDSSYNIEINLSSANGYFTPAQARPYYGKYSRDGVTYHWWNRPERIADTDHDSQVAYMNRNAAAGAAPTVNYVASGRQLTMLINPDNVAWCSNNGNATTISVECSPHLTDEFYKKLGWLHDQLEQRYNKTLAIYVHFDWTPTECSPIVKSRIRAEADAWKQERLAPVPPPAPAPVPATVTVEVTDIVNKKVRLVRDANLWDLGFTKYADAKAVKTLPAGTIIEVSATAKHPLGSTYYLSEYSFQKGIKNGINVKDCEDYVDVVAPPTPVVTPPEPIPAPVPVEVPISDHDKKQDAQIASIQATLKAIVDFLTSIFKSFKI